MYKKILYALILTLVFCNLSWASFDFGLVTVNDNLRFPIFALDDTGKVAIPDSIHLMVWFEGEATSDTASYVERIATAGATPDLIDSLVVGGYDYYYFDHLVADIDNDEGEGNYAGTVILWTDGQPYFNNFTFMLHDIESEVLYNELQWILDTLQNQDNWVATTTNQTLIIDSLNAVLDSLQDGIYGHDVNIVSIKDDLATADSLNQAMDGYNNAGLTLFEYAKDNSVGISSMLIGVAVSSIDNNVITSSVIATNAIGIDEIAAAIYEEMWRNIDTLNIDTSLIGKWLQGINIDSIVVYNAIAQLMLDSSITRADSSQRWIVRQFSIKGSNTGMEFGNASFFIQNEQNGGHGIVVEGDTTSGAAGHGFVSRGDYGGQFLGLHNYGLIIADNDGIGTDLQIGQSGTGRIAGHIDYADSVSANGMSKIANIVNDSLLQYFTMINDNRSVTFYYADVDTVFIFSSAADTIGAIIYFHPGGVAGDPPDSTRYKDM